MALDVLEEIMKDKEDIKVQLGKEDKTEGTPVIRIFRETLRPKHVSTVRRRNVTGTAFVLDLVNGMDSSTLMDSGYTSWMEVRRVVNTNDVWIDYLRQNTFMDGEITTATPDYTNFKIDLARGRLYQTIPIFHDDKSIDSVIVALKVGEDFKVTSVDRGLGGRRVNFT